MTAVDLPPPIEVGPIGIFKVSRQFDSIEWLCSAHERQRADDGWGPVRVGGVVGRCTDCENERQAPAVDAWRSRWRERIPGRRATDVKGEKAKTQPDDAPAEERTHG